MIRLGLHKWMTMTLYYAHKHLYNTYIYKYKTYIAFTHIKTEQYSLPNTDLEIQHVMS